MCIRDSVNTAHGLLPVPAPATALLLAGFPIHQDGLEGERITPTGAAILKHLAPDFRPMGNAGALTGSGTGFGTKRFPGISNILRVTRFEAEENQQGARSAVREDSIGVCEFEVDDQSPEDLAEALETLRGTSGVLAVVKTPAFGKNGRLCVQVQVLAQLDALERAGESALVQTSTLGVRWRVTSRSILERTLDTVEVGGRAIQIKRAKRPDGHVTSKAEHRDIAAHAKTYAERKQLRTVFERDPSKESDGDH